MSESNKQNRIFLSTTSATCIPLLLIFVISCSQSSLGQPVEIPPDISLDVSPGPSEDEIAQWQSDYGIGTPPKIGDVLTTVCDQKVYYNGPVASECLGTTCISEGQYGPLRQCTEFAARFSCELFLDCKKKDGSKGKEGSYGNAKYWFDGTYSHSNNILKEIPDSRRFSNGKTTELPRPGDILVFSDSGAGHVAIVRSVDIAAKFLVTVEQNTGAVPTHRRPISIAAGTGLVTVTSGGNSSIVGWMRPSAGPLPDCLAIKCSDRCWACDGSTGKCLQCLEPYAGPSCEQCAPSYKLGPQGCIPDTGPDILIPGGSFTMGSDIGNVEWVPHSVNVSPFYLDTTEVTLGDYRKCVDAATAGRAIRGFRPDDCYWLNDTTAGCNWQAQGVGSNLLPVNCIDYQRAEYYCKWAGKRLPTEEEWEYAARGTIGATYPWGNDLPASQLCWNRSSTCPVGGYPKTLLGNYNTAGLADLAGNVAEWTSSFNCAYPSKTSCDLSKRIIRGSHFGDASNIGVFAFKRIATEPVSSGSGLGFRCARSQ